MTLRITDPPGPRAGGSPRGSGAAGRNTWQKALAEHRKRQRNQRGRRSTDPYKRYLGVRKPPDQEAT